MSSEQKKYRILALYLPQFHPIPENDKWWGKGFTEWTNVGKAKPLYPGHYQPRVPADLGYYDLRVSETRQQQADLARQYGVEGFCYWHYWFGDGKELLERPFKEVLESRNPDFPFCLAWANESWKGFYHGLNGREVLIEQKYPSEEDHINHFNHLLPAFKDQRYIRKNGKPFFMLFRPENMPDVKSFISLWQRLAMDNGLPGLYFIGHTYDSSSVDSILNMGFDSVETVNIFRYTGYLTLWDRVITKLGQKFLKIPRIVSYKKASSFFVADEDHREEVISTIIPNWDHSPRTARKGVVFHNSNPDLFKKHLLEVKKVVDSKADTEPFVFIKSWNEWAEGNYMEPDLKYGRKYLESLKQVFFNGEGNLL